MEAGGGRGGGGGGGGRGGRRIAGRAYSVRLTVDGQTYTQKVTIKPDPRGELKGVVEDSGGGE